MNEEFVSVIMPVFNREESVGKSIESVLSQTVKDIELIIVDDGSTDHTIDVIKSFNDNRIRLKLLGQNSGANHARNIGIEMAKGHYVAFIDSDDRWTHDKLEIQLKYMKDNGLKASFTPYRIENTNTIIPRNYSKYLDFAEVRNTLRKYNIIGTPTLVVDRDVLISIGGFDESLPRLQDYELSIRIVQKYDIGCCDKVLLDVSVDGNYRISQNDENLYTALGIILDKHFSFFCFSKDSLFVQSFCDSNGILDLERIENIDKYCKSHAREWMVAAIEEANRKRNLYEELHCYEKQYNLNQLKSNAYVIWGAGKKGKEIYRELKKEDIYPAYFVVSVAETIEDIDGIPVVTVDSIDTSKYKVVVGVERETQLEILSKINDYKFKTLVTI